MKPINEQIDPKFVTQSKKLAKYTQLLHRILPIECRNHVEVANIRNQNLMLITDSPVWTTRLRQLCPQILQFIRENTQNIDTGRDKSQIIHHIQISTRYNAVNESQQQGPEKKAHHKPHMTEKTAEILSQSASSIAHPQLKSALLKLASNKRKK